MKGYFMKRYPDVPVANLFTEEKSIDTAGNAEEVALWLSEQQLRYRRIGLITVGYHLKNAATLFSNYGVDIAETYPSEQVLGSNSNLLGSYVRGWSQTNRVKQEEKKEFVRTLLLPIDRKGRLLRVLTARTRK
jgi:uncharacterized SAM-binding protein YcdF (DUF218 family)